MTDNLFQQTFKIFNTSEEPISFKIKTTSPKQYCVRPNVGIIPPKSFQEIEGSYFLMINKLWLLIYNELVLLQARKDKFLVLATKAIDTTLEEVNRPDYVCIKWKKLICMTSYLVHLIFSG